MVCKTDDFYFDPEKTALENLFALIFRTNKVRLNNTDLDVSPVEAIPEDCHGDNTKITVTGKPGSPIKGSADLYYARADINTHYPTFYLDVAEVAAAGCVNDRDALIQFLDGKFNLVDGEFDVDIDDPFTSILDHLSIDLIANDDSYIYIGKKTIHVFWSGGLRRVTDEGRIRVTDEGMIRVVVEDDPVNP